MEKDVIKQNQKMYEEHGAKNRTEYISNLADQYGVPLDMAMIAADTLGPTEDFDGLVSTLQDYEYMGF